MAYIQSGRGPTLQTVDPTSEAARVTLYNSDGTINSAASETTLTATNTKLDALFGAVSALLTDAELRATPLALSTGAATSAKQDTLIAKDFATQTTTAAILAKIITSPATEATISSINNNTGVKASDGLVVHPDNVVQTLAYNLDSTLNTITITEGGFTYIQTMTYTAGKVTGISNWVKQ